GQLPHASPELTNVLIEEGFLSYNDITCIDAAGLTEFYPTLAEPQADEVIMYAEEYADVMEQSVEEERRQAEEAAEQALLEAEAQAQAEAEAQAAANPEEAASTEAGTATEGETGETSAPTEPDEPAIVSNS